MGFPVIIAAEYGLMFSSPILRFGTQNSLAMGFYGLQVRYGSFSREKPSLSWMRPVWSTIYTYLQGNFHTWIYMIYMGYSKSECYEHVIGRFLAETPCDSLGMQWRQPQAALITQKKNLCYFHFILEWSATFLLWWAAQNQDGPTGSQTNPRMIDADVGCLMVKICWKIPTGWC
jgi:hypothetical protein